LFKLGQIQAAFLESKQNFENQLQLKEATIEDLQMKIAYMTSEFENMLNVRFRLTQETLNKIIKKLEIASQKWKDNDQITLSEANTRRLEDFQLTRLALSHINHG
jgi:hypothetical protein